MRFFNLAIVEDPSPMKRGLKAVPIRYVPATNDVEDPSPMKRGLKGAPRDSLRALSRVEDPSPMKRGLKGKPRHCFHQADAGLKTLPR